jgi:cysteine desulfurase
VVVYLDYAATAPLRPEAAAAWAATSAPGNPSSLHAAGRAARASLEDARETIAHVFGAASAEVVFTSGGTEADNLAVAGIFHARQADRSRPHVLVSAVEHHGVLETAALLAARHGARVRLLPVGADGIVRLEAVAEHLAALGDATALISVMAANNETGARQPVERIAELAAAAGVPMHSDVVQAAGKVAWNFGASHLMAASLSGHKLGGPVGVGVLLARRQAPLVAMGGGGGQERGLRSGTLDTRGAAGFAAAALAGAEGGATGIEQRGKQLEALLAPLDALVAASGGALVNRTPPAHTPGIRLVTAPGCAAEVLTYLLDREGIAVSAGSACTAGVVRSSHVLEAMGLGSEAGSGIRVSLGYASAPQDVAALVAALPSVLELARVAGAGRGGVSA